MIRTIEGVFVMFSEKSQKELKKTKNSISMVQTSKPSPKSVGAQATMALQIMGPEPKSSFLLPLSRAVVRLRDASFSVLAQLSVKGGR